MKVKGINPIEQHIEKIVLALVALVLLGVLAMQFLTQPNQVDVGGRAVPPQDVFVVLERQAETLDSQLKDAAPAVPEVKQTDLVQRYDEAFGTTGDAPARLAAPLGRGVDVASVTGADIGSAGPSSDEVALLEVPAPTDTVAASQWGTLDPYAVSVVPAYAAFVPAEQPFDLPWVTVESAFSGTALREALSPADGVGVPRRFWQATGMAVLALESERQRLLPDGSWSQAEPVVTPPGTPAPTRALAEDAGLPELTELVSKAATAAPEIQRPMTPPTIAGPEWVPPSERVAGADSQMTEADRIRRNLERAVAELERLQNTTGTAPTQDPGRDPRRPSYSPGSSPGQTTDRTQRRIEQLSEQINELRTQLRDMGEPDPTAPGAAQPTRTDRPGVRPGSPADALQLLEQESVALWTHDLGVEPGATYRYRTRVVLNNPLFRKGPVLDAEDEALQAAATQPFVRSDWSDWTDPVVVGAREYFFVTNADPAGAMSGGRAAATVEVFRMFFGHYRKSTLTLAPGDPVEASVRIPDGLFLIDTAVIEPRAAADAMLGETPASLPAGLTPATGRLSLQLGAYVLDVTTRPTPVTDDLGRATTVSEVILRGRDGDILVRTGRQDTATPAYELASSSSAAASRTPLREPGQPATSPAADLFVPAEGRP